MGNCVSLIKRKREPSKPITLAIIGVDNVGKTTLCSVFAGETPDPDVAPTVGFRNIKFSQSNFDITLFDLGGGKNIRPIWKSYFGEVYGVIYVVDSSSPSTLYEAREVLRDALEHPQISGKPVLILANKVDRDDHLDEVDMANGLKMDETVSANKCPSKMVMVSALQGTGNKKDKELESGLQWLLDKIRDMFGTLEPRVEDDKRRAKEAKDKEREERRARVQKQREEREKKEAREREHLGIQKEDSDEDIVDGDPFKALDMNKLVQKEQRMKEEKRRKADLMKQFERGSTLRGQSKDDSQLRSADDNFRSGLVSRSLDQSDNSYAALNLFSNRRKGGSSLPPLEPLGTNTREAPAPVPGERKKGKKKKKLTDFGKDRGDREDTGGRLGLSMGDADSWNRDIGAHDLTPRVAKPKKARAVKAGRIEEDVDEDDLYKDRGLLEKNLFSIDNMRGNSYKQNKYDDIYPSKGGNRELSRLTKRNGDLGMEREDSMYRNSLKKISPPNMTKFEEEDEDIEKDEGIEEESDSDDVVNSYRAGRNARNYNVNGTSGKKSQRSSIKDYRVKDRPPLSDEEQEDYLSHSVLKDTMRFPSSPTDDEVPIDFRKEMERLHQRKNQGVVKGREMDKQDSRYTKHERHTTGGGSRGKKYYDDDDEDEEEERRYKIPSRFKSSNNRYPSEDEDDDRQIRHIAKADNPKKKKHSYLLRSNKLAPSDDDEVEPQASYRFTSPRMVQEHGSRNGSDAETPTKNRNSRLTQFHSNMSRDSASDFSAKWGLAEDLPSVGDDNRRFRTPNFDDSDDNVMF